MTPSRPALGRKLRSDAHRNRERVVQAAVAAVHREGPGVSMATIAAGAEVGIGTVYRHFPTREALLEELTRRSFELMLLRISHATDASDTAVDALRLFLTAVIRERDDLVLPSTGGPSVTGNLTRAAQRRLHAAIRALIDSGTADGTIRREVDVSDVAWLGATLAPPGRPGRAWETTAGRLLETYLAGLAVPDRGTSAPPSTSPG